MRIKLSPQRRDDTLQVTKLGNVLTLNGEPFDFSPMADGDTLPSSAIASEWFSGNVDNISGELVLTLILPNPYNYSSEQAFPVDLIDVPDGPIALPGPLSDEETAAKFPPITVQELMNSMSPGDATALLLDQIAQTKKADGELTA